jgi:hypothetical protein
VIAPCCREAAAKNKNLSCGLQVKPMLGGWVCDSAGWERL